MPLIVTYTGPFSNKQTRKNHPKLKNGAANAMLTYLLIG